jgi:hypothetical protein
MVLIVFVLCPVCPVNTEITEERAFDRISEHCHSAPTAPTIASLDLFGALIFELVHC